MVSIVQIYEDFMSVHRDGRVDHWPLMDSPLPTIFISLVYLAAVLVLLPAYMSDTKPFNITKLIRAYNIFLIVSYSIIIYTASTSGWLQGDYSFGCQPIDYSDNPKAVNILKSIYWFYLLKAVELFETVFFVLRKKSNQVSKLHLYHHVSTFWLSWIGCKFVGGGMATVPIILNSFIHVLMYSYYYLASCGPEWQKTLAPWKPKLTLIQMIQFTFLILHALFSLAPDCKVPKQLLLLYLPNVVLIYKMFYDFYQASYNKKKV